MRGCSSASGTLLHAPISLTREFSRFRAQLRARVRARGTRREACAEARQRDASSKWRASRCWATAVVPADESMTTGSIAAARADFCARFSDMAHAHDLVQRGARKVAMSVSTFAGFSIDGYVPMGLYNIPKNPARSLK